jgi:DNA-binding NtrC family response regulator
LEVEGFKAQFAYNGVQASALLKNLHFDVVLMDVRLADADMERCYREALPYLGQTPVIFTIATGETDRAVRLLKAGAFDCVQKPYEMSDLIARLRSAVEQRSSPARCWPDPVMVSPKMKELAGRIDGLASTDLSFIVFGESGTGKEVFARYIHRVSARTHEPFVEILCASLAEPNGESILFGELDELNSRARPGVLDEVGHGTLYLSEIESLSPVLQSRLAQVMDEGRFRRIGDFVPRPFQARIVAATALSSAKLRERMRPNLFHRLAVIELEIPPLRDRQKGLESLVATLRDEVAIELQVPARPIDPEAMSAMRAHDWPGNVRELRNRLSRAMSLPGHNKITVEDLFPDFKLSAMENEHISTLGRARINAERQRIVEALAANEGRIGPTAHSLGISRVTLWAKMKKFGIKHEGDSLS